MGKVQGWADAAEAKAEIVKSVAAIKYFPLQCRKKPAKAGFFLENTFATTIKIEPKHTEIIND